MTMAETKARHHWQKSGQTKQCATCDLQDVGSVRDGVGNWHSIWRSGATQVISARTPECGKPLPEPAPAAERAQLATDADKGAHAAFLAGDYERAAHLVEAARVLDPARAELWSQRDAGIRQAIEKSTVRERAKSPDERIKEAGRQYPEEMQHWQQWNYHAQLRAGHEPELGG
jgi:hypothetical protein